MANYRVEVKSGRKGTCVEHSRYDARVGNKREDRDDLIGLEFGNFSEGSHDKPLVFWKHADKHERKNAAAHREWIISLPNELDHEQNMRLGRRIAMLVAGPRPWQMAFHGPEGKLSGNPSPHIHVMTSDRAPDGIPRPPPAVFLPIQRQAPRASGVQEAQRGHDASAVEPGIGSHPGRHRRSDERGTGRRWVGRPRRSPKPPSSGHRSNPGISSGPREGQEYDGRETPGVRSKQGRRKLDPRRGAAPLGSQP